MADVAKVAHAAKKEEDLELEKKASLLKESTTPVLRPAMRRASMKLSTRKLTGSASALKSNESVYHDNETPCQSMKSPEGGMQFFPVAVPEIKEKNEEIANNEDHKALTESDVDIEIPSDSNRRVGFWMGEALKNAAVTADLLTAGGPPTDRERDTTTGGKEGDARDEIVVDILPMRSDSNHIGENITSTPDNGVIQGRQNGDSGSPKGDLDTHRNRVESDTENEARNEEELGKDSDRKRDTAGDLLSKDEGNITPLKPGNVQGNAFFATALTGINNNKTAARAMFPRAISEVPDVVLSDVEELMKEVFMESRKKIVEKPKSKFKAQLALMAAKNQAKKIKDANLREAAKNKVKGMAEDHPLLGVFFVNSIARSRTARLTLYITTLMSTFMTSSTFYNTPAGDEENTETDKCESFECQMFERMTGLTMVDIVMTLINNVLTLPLGIVAVIFFQTAFIDRNDEDLVRVGTLKARLRKPSIKLIVGYIIAFLYNIFCVYAVAIFAATREDDSEVIDWMATFVMVNVSDLFFWQNSINIVRMISLYILGWLVAKYLTIGQEM
eukprot:TRINITY_DN5164_c0_g1_i1.p1 TRINITY_DN5164_c0_g1~~TRINITY_DN5164_c0_g1_i1.p1  ORF type:complete len:559 (-),score=92.00 TRINITY_DN5164_c0_g1_i1:39-1715(-)